jgi:hypothetical protein
VIASLAAASSTAAARTSRSAARRIAPGRRVDACFALTRAASRASGADQGLAAADRVSERVSAFSTRFSVLSTFRVRSRDAPVRSSASALSCGRASGASAGGIGKAFATGERRARVGARPPVKTRRDARVS